MSTGALRRSFNRFRAFFHKRLLDIDLDAEMSTHLELAIEENIKRGLSPEEARRQALIRFGGVEQAKEHHRDARGLPALDSLLQDFRYAFRQLRKNPGFAFTAILTLALGIGANTAIFSIVDAVLLHESPYRNLSELVQIDTKSPKGENGWVSAGDFNDWQTQNQTFEGLAAYKSFDFRVLTGDGDPDQVWVSPVSANTFHLLGVNAAIGLTFAGNDTQTAILSHEYWLSRFSGDCKVIGRTVALDGKPYTVIGVAPADFEFPKPNTQMWVPLVFTAAEKNDHEHRLISVIARLKAGVTLQKAQAALDVTAQRLAAKFPKADAGWTAAIRPFKLLELTPFLRSVVLALLAAVGFVLAIACFNVMSMLLARGAVRQAEVAIRAALGAGRLRLIRQLVVESILLTGGASLAGLLLASWGLRWVVNLLPKYSLIETQALHRISINFPVLAFAVALAIVTGTVVGIVPALRVSGVDLNDSLKLRDRLSTTISRGSGLQRALIVSEVASALALLIGAGLMIRSFERLQAAPTGFNPEHLLTVRVPLVNYKYAPGPQSAVFYRSVLERIRAIPGVRAAGMANNLPFTGFHTSVDFPSPPNSPGGPGHVFYVATRSVSPGYFRAMGILLKEGRDFAPSDDLENAPCVLAVNETLARLYWGGEDPVGRLMPDACPKDKPALIVGVLADSKQDSPELGVQPEVYHPYSQFPFASFLVTFVVRTSANPATVAAAVRRAVWDVDHDQPVIQVRTMENVISESMWRQRVSASVLGIFAAIALLLSSVGIYGVFSYSVSRRIHEIGIRMALGATRGDILKMVVREGLVLTSVGVGSGFLAALALTRLLARLLYGVSPKDPLTFVCLSMLLAGVALLACYIPARRASMVDPIVALRHE